MRMNWRGTCGWVHHGTRVVPPRHPSIVGCIIITFLFIWFYFTIYKDRMLFKKWDVAENPSNLYAYGPFLNRMPSCFVRTPSPYYVKHGYIWHSNAFCFLFWSAHSIFDNCTLLCGLPCKNATNNAPWPGWYLLSVWAVGKDLLQYARHWRREIYI